jgi:hypothetical protein
MLITLLALTIPLGELLLVVVPLKMLTKQYIDCFTDLGIPVVRLRDAGKEPQQYSQRVVLVAMEELTEARQTMLLNSKFWQHAVAAIVFDEVHLFPLWSKYGFRPVLAGAYELRQFFRRDVPIATLTGSPDPWLRSRISALFGLRRDSAHPEQPPDIYSECLTLPRITPIILVEMNGWSSDLDYAFEKLGVDFSKIARREDLPQTIIHVKDRQRTVTIAFEYEPFVALNARFPGCVIPLHGISEEPLQNKLVSGLRTGSCRIAVVTQVGLKSLDRSNHSQHRC